MDGLFSGVSTDNIEHFFMSMIVFDVGFPHTDTRLSPITFNDFMIRNQVLCINSMQVYNEACKFWARYFSFNKAMLRSAHDKYDLNICNEPHGGWNKLVDHLNRLLDVNRFEGNPYYQMHYIAHCCHGFFCEKFKDAEEYKTNKIVFNEIISPIIYDPVVPTQYSFLPILNFADLRFMERVAMMCSRIDAFMENHCGRTMNHHEFDINHLKMLYDIVTEGLKGVRDNKYNGNAWLQQLQQCIAKTTIIQADVNACELKDVFERDGMKCCSVLKVLKRIGQRNERNAYSDDPDLAFDELLDAYKLCADGLKSYNIPEVKKHERN